jgi:hypothetical protein
MKDYGWLRDDIGLCVAMFVRHQMAKGTYPLFSLGKEPDPDHPRKEITEENTDTYIAWGSLCME